MMHRLLGVSMLNLSALCCDTYPKHGYQRTNRSSTHRCIRARSAPQCPTILGQSSSQHRIHTYSSRRDGTYSANFDFSKWTLKPTMIDTISDESTHHCITSSLRNLPFIHSTSYHQKYLDLSSNNISSVHRKSSLRIR